MPPAGRGANRSFGIKITKLFRVGGWDGLPGAAPPPGTRRNGPGGGGARAPCPSAAWRQGADVHPVAGPRREVRADPEPVAADDDVPPLDGPVRGAAHPVDGDG